MIHRYIIEATDEVKGFEKAIEKLDREWGIEELEPCEDAISKQALIERIDNAEENFKIDNMDSISSDVEDPFVDGVLSGVFNIRQMVAQAPSVTPKTKTDVLDMIRYEIMDTGAYEQEVNGNTEFLKGINYCLGVINKYKAESEG